jgi:chaperonin cofactor prefoldin
MTFLDGHLPDSRSYLPSCENVGGQERGYSNYQVSLWRDHLHSGSGQRYTEWRKGRGVMIESIMYLGIGFLVAAFLGLLFIPLVHNRAVRLTMKRLEASMPLSIAEVRADKDQVRAEFAVSTRRLEMRIEKLKAQTASQLAELGKKTDAINLLKKDIAEKNVMNVMLGTRDKTLRDQLRAAEEELHIKSNALVEADRQLAENQAELAKVLRELGERTLVA